MHALHSYVQALMLSTAAREAVDEAAALKQHEAQQRAQLLGDLDSGRARLNRIQEGCSTLTVNKVLPSTTKYVCTCESSSINGTTTYCRVYTY
jgi:hypothetical protein